MTARHHYDDRTVADQRPTRTALREFFAGLVSDELLEAYGKLLPKGTARRTRLRHSSATSVCWMR